MRGTQFDRRNCWYKKVVNVNREGKIGDDSGHVVYIWL